MAKKIKKLFRSRTNWLVSGICGGLGEYWNTDPTIVRLCLVVLTILTGVIPLTLIYILAAMVIPLEPDKGRKEVIAGWIRFHS